MKKVLLALIPALFVASITLTSCNNCCSGNGEEVCKDDGEYTDEEWDAIVDLCDESDECSCS